MEGVFSDKDMSLSEALNVTLAKKKNLLLKYFVKLRNAPLIKTLTDSKSKILFLFKTSNKTFLKKHYGILISSDVQETVCVREKNLK